MSDSEEENYCFYGKALEPYDEDAVPKKKPISVEDQIATDAQGRRRFHGAFTGGFSAGFYNTVGSLEGWKPAEFKSSRSDKAHTKQLKPEDFMDDEDIGEHGIAPQTVQATKDYANNRKRKKQVFADGPIPGEPVLHTLITSGSETIGYLLMKNMDLKQRSTELEKGYAAEPKVYGCVMPKTYEIKRNFDNENVVHEVYASFIKNPKSNTFGLGYEGLNKTHLNLFKSTQLIVKDQNDKKLSISGQAFGVGAFENEDDDIYAKDDMTQYDFELTKEKKAITKGKSPQMVFDEFLLSKVPLLPTQKFPPPVIPHSFSGKHKVRKSRFEPIIEEKIERKDMTAAIRAKYIGEECREDSQPSTSSSQSTSNITQEESTEINKDMSQSSSVNMNSSDLFLDKFVSASQSENPHDILEEVKKSEVDHGTKEMRDAAKLKMYGPLTRIITDWQPCSMLCKRFNVREPLLDDKTKRNERKKNHIIFEYQKNNEDNITLEPGLKITAKKEIEESLQVANSAIISEISNTTQNMVKIEGPPATVIPEPATIAMDTTQEKDKPPPDITDKIDVSKNIDLFRAVFLSSSESESDEDEKKEEEEKSRETMMKENVLSDYLIPKIKNPKEGILSHIKFNPLFKKKDSESAETNVDEKLEESNEKSNTPQDIPTAAVTKDWNMYGPALPDKIQVSSTCSYLPNIVVDEEWVEKGDVERKKSHKHKKKHKKEKHHKKEHKSKHKY